MVAISFVWWRKPSPLEWFALFLALVVIAGVACPVRTRDGYSPAAFCLSNVKQMGMGLLMYTTDYDDRLPATAGWMDTIKPYIKNGDKYHDGALSSRTDYGYELNQILSLRALKSFQNPEQQVSIFDSVKLGRSEVGTLADLPSPGRHDGKNALGFLDGHVKVLESKP